MYKLIKLYNTYNYSVAGGLESGSSCKGWVVMVCTFLEQMYHIQHPTISIPYSELFSLFLWSYEIKRAT